MYQPFFYKPILNKSLSNSKLCGTTKIEIMYFSHFILLIKVIIIF